MTGKIIAKKLHEIQNSISGALNYSEIKEMMSLFGYHEDKITEGQVKLDNVKALMARQIDIYGDQYAQPNKPQKNGKKHTAII